MTGVREWITTTLRDGLIRNIAVLSGMQIASYLLPLATLPYLTRVLGPTTWGLVAFAWALGQYVIVMVEYGFNLSATRQVALHHDNRNKLTDLLAGVLGAKVLLSFFAIGLAFLVQRWVPSFREHHDLLWSAIFWGLAQGFSLIWYFQGLERMGLVAALEISAKALATVGIFLLVSSPQDGWKVLALQGMASFLSLIVALGLAYSKVPFRFPTPSLTWETLRSGWHMFISRGAISLYTVSNVFILGLFAPPQLVGYYAGAEKITTALLGLLRPVNQALYPRLSYLTHTARAEAARLCRIVTAAMGMGGVLIGLALFLLAPLVVRILLGEDFDPAVPVLQILALLLPIVAFSNALGIQWMLPLRLERSFNVIIIGAGVLNLLLALLLVPHYSHLGMAWTVVTSELFVTVGIYGVLRWQGLDPFRYIDRPRKERTLFED